ncbi:hypothetical protein CFHF_14340 [Caulobacter flavus]|uniref:Uncharacterized protein n=1 Tax=Caulobacter flavus TaxID=1679497 RepID=A0A2N5CSD0_9CAUL|nr:hypothetical protein C1707_23910 [Caulobacter flavus]PLR13359.1 hypothetical protein CFHF_14340 [Caulobacter flavus]
MARSGRGGRRRGHGDRGLGGSRRGGGVRRDPGGGGFHGHRASGSGRLRPARPPPGRPRQGVRRSQPDRGPQCRRPLVGRLRLERTALVFQLSGLVDVAAEP